MTWTKITYADEAATALPAWLVVRMLGVRGSFGLLLSTGDVMRVSSVVAINMSSSGLVLLDVMLDRPGVPDDVDFAWAPKQFLGATVIGATLATVNLAHVVAAVEFTAPVDAEMSTGQDLPANDEVDIDRRVDEAEAVGAAD